MKINVVKHPLLDAKLTILRNKETPSGVFRQVLEEVSMFLAYEALKTVSLKEISIETPIQKDTKGYDLNEEIIVVPIFRAGLGMVNGVKALYPNLREGHVGIYRDEETLESTVYYNKLPKTTKGSRVLILDPMLATGTTIIDAIGEIKKGNPDSISVLSIVSAQAGIDRLGKAHPDVDLYVASIDEGLNDKGYIYPGLGDAGDRIFGTK